MWQRGPEERDDERLAIRDAWQELPDTTDDFERHTAAALALVAADTAAVIDITTRRVAR